MNTADQDQSNETITRGARPRPVGVGETAPPVDMQEHGMHEPPELEPTHAPLVELQSSAPRDLSAIARALTPQDGGDDLIRRLRGALERKG